jgi:hypothetical protein
MVWVYIGGIANSFHVDTFQKLTSWNWVISLCHQYRAMLTCTSMQYDQALYCWKFNFLYVDIEITDTFSEYIVLNSKLGKSIIQIKQIKG